jgi:hypothetical protein
MAALDQTDSVTIDQIHEPLGELIGAGTSVVRGKPGKPVVHPAGSLRRPAAETPDDTAERIVAELKQAGWPSPDRPLSEQVLHARSILERSPLNLPVDSDNRSSDHSDSGPGEPGPGTPRVAGLLTAAGTAWLFFGGGSMLGFAGLVAADLVVLAAMMIARWSRYGSGGRPEWQIQPTAWRANEHFAQFTQEFAQDLVRHGVRPAAARSMLHLLEEPLDALNPPAALETFRVFEDEGPRLYQVWGRQYRLFFTYSEIGGVVTFLGYKSVDEITKNDKVVREWIDHLKQLPGNLNRIVLKNRSEVDRAANRLFGSSTGVLPPLPSTGVGVSGQGGVGEPPGPTTCSTNQGRIR